MTATGVPKPASASSSAPKQKATMIGPHAQDAEQDEEGQQRQDREHGGERHGAGDGVRHDRELIQHNSHPGLSMLRNDNLAAGQLRRPSEETIGPGSPALSY
ncbi:hypothetical protein [Actinoplanes sp. NPDC049118]|uniref:hypothetical protein n=1 Tax=Actinoplanes sp. NPDC049118 TaxID=3155769 RepID=UPI0033C6C4D4